MAYTDWQNTEIPSDTRVSLGVACSWGGRSLAQDALNSEGTEKKRALKLPAERAFGPREA